MSTWNVISRIVWFALGTLVLIGMGFMFIPLIQLDQEYHRREEQLRHDIQTKQQAIRELQLKQERFESDPAFLERIAHEFGLAKPGETLFRFIDEN